MTRAQIEIVIRISRTSPARRLARSYARLPRTSRRPRDGEPSRGPGLAARQAQSVGAAIGLIPDRSSRLTRIAITVMISASSAIPAETR